MTVRSIALMTLISTLALACGSVHIVQRISPRELLSNRDKDFDTIPLSRRTYERLPLYAMEREINALLSEATDQEMPPAAVFAVGDELGLILTRFHGFARLEPGRPLPTAQGTIFDLASLTKVVATTTAVLQLVDRGQIDLDTPIVTYLPEYDNHGKDRITVRQCLTHTAGFVPFYRLWTECETAEEARAFIETCELESEPGSQYHYSDVGFVTLGWLVERVSGQRLDAYCRDNIFRPLGMTQTMFLPPEGLRPMCAATEFDRVLRNVMIQGEVHDENAHFLGGVAGHAGLFSTVDDLTRFCLMLLNGGEWGGVRILETETVAEMTREQLEMPDPNDGEIVRRGLGWFLRSEALLSSCGGQDFSSATFGHTGFTGPAIQIDPERKIFAIFLANRLHARASERDTADWRAESWRRYRPVRVGFFNTVAEGIH